MNFAGNVARFQLHSTDVLLFATLKIFKVK